MVYSNLVNCHFIDARVRVRLLARIDEKLLTSCFDDFTCDSQDWENNLTSFYAVVCISLRGSSQPVVVKIKSVVAKIRKLVSMRKRGAINAYKTS